MKLSISNIFLLIVSGLLLSFCIFYLGARFGPEMFWGINLSEIEHNALLPPEVLDQELQALLKEDSPEMNFQQVLSGKMVKEEITGDMKEPMREEKPIEVKESAPTPPVNPVKETKVAARAAERPVLGAEPKGPEAPEVRREVRREKVAVVSAPAPVAPKVAAVAAPAPIAPPQPSALFSLQVGSFQDETSAQAAVKQYQARGYAPKMKTLQLPSKGTWYKVYIGNYSSREEADSARADVAVKYKGAPLIVQVQ